MNVEKDFLNWYKNKMEDDLTFPPESTWESIHDQLDVDDVWERLDKKLTRIRFLYRAKRTAYYAAAAAIALLVITQTFVDNQSPVNQDIINISKIYKSEHPSQTLTAVNQKNRNQREMADFRSEASLRYAGSVPVFDSMAYDAAVSIEQLTTNNNIKPYPHLSETNPATDIIAANNSINTTTNTLDKAKTISKSNYYTWPEKTANKLLASNTIIDKKEKISNPPRFYIGFTNSVRNTWLLNNTTVRGLQSNEMTKTVPNIFQDFAFQAGIHFSRKSKLLLEADIITSNQQKYYQYLNGDYVSKEIELSYSVFSLLYKYNISKLFGHNGVGNNLVLGSYGGILKSGKLKTKEQTENIKYQYHKYDIGFILGYELEFVVFNKIALAPGIRLKQGLFNIYKGYEDMPSSFNRTYPATIDFTFGVNYIIR
jgi:hypothetical protein